MDRYGEWVVVQEYAPPKDSPCTKSASTPVRIIAATLSVLGTVPNKLVLKTRERQKGKNQYQRRVMRKVNSLGKRVQRAPVGEPDDYLDNGFDPSITVLRAVCWADE
ncbi:hypothetical protein ACNKHK_06075 [Shigella flexneri]